MANSPLLPNEMSNDIPTVDPMQDPVAALAAAPQREPAATPPPQGPVNVINPEGKLVSIPGEQLQDAVNDGYRQASDQEVDHYAKEQKYGTPTELLKTAVEGVGQGVLGPLSPAIAKAFGETDEDIRNRAEFNPGTHYLSEVAGLGGSILTGAGIGGLATKAGEAGLAATGLLKAGESASILAKIGSAAVKGAIENAVIQGSDETSKMILHDPNQTAQTAITDIGLASLIGGGVAGGIGTIPPLWRASGAPKLGGLLKAIADKAGGVEGTIPDAMDEALTKAGITLEPHVKAGLSEIPEVQQMFKTLEQSDTTKSGLKLQADYGKARKDLGDSIVKSLGKDPEMLTSSPEISKYETGKSVGNTLAEEYQKTMEPLAKEFEDLKAKYQNAELFDDAVMKDGGLDYSDPYNPKSIPPQRVPGTVSTIANRVGELAEKEGWTTSPSSDMMKEVNRVLKELPRQNTLKDLNNFASAIGENTKSTLPFGQQTPLSRAGQLIKNIVRDVESDVALQRLGEEAPELVGRYKMAREAYKAQAALKDALDDRLHIGGSTAGFAKGLRNMAQTDGESLIRKLSGAGDADLLNLLQSKFPKTADLVRQYHVDQLLDTAAKKAKAGETISSGVLLSNLSKMSPELKNFIASPENLGKIEAVSTLLEQFQKLPHNFSNTARTVDKLFEYIPGSAIGIATGVLGHSAGYGLLAAAATKILGKDAPDAIRLAMLKFLGSSSKIEPNAFKSMVDFFHSAVKGENLTSKASKALFTAGREVLPETQIPTQKDRDKLEKALKNLHKDSSSLMNVGGDTSHYLPDHGSAIASTASNAVNYLNSLKPNTDKRAPLGSEIKPNAIQKANYNRALDIAQQPLVVMQKIKEGRLVPKDVEAIRAMYPDLYTRLSQKISNDMVSAVDKGVNIPYKTRLGLSLFLGQALDPTMTPESIRAAQPMQQEVQQGRQQAPVTKHSANSLAKLPGAYQTPSQAREQHRLKG